MPCHGMDSLDLPTPAHRPAHVLVLESINSFFSSDISSRFGRQVFSTRVMKQHNFFDDVYEVVKLVPSGRVTTYGAIANYLGTKMSARMVGWAMNAAHAMPEVPAHRVLNRSGILTGKAHFTTPTFMQELLEAEGIKVTNDQVVDFEKILWLPILELRI